MPFVLMKIFELSPDSFDVWMSLLTLGRLEKIREELVSPGVNPGEEVLEIGCGTGTLAAQLAAKGARVVGIDVSEEMLDTARRKVAAGPLDGAVAIERVSALEIEDAFAADRFDQIISVLTFSELSDDEVDCVLAQCRRVLRPGGKILVVDEVEPEGFFKRWIFRILRFPARLLTFLLLQLRDLKSVSFLKKVLYYVTELPLMLLTFLVVPSPTHPLANLEARIREAGFEVAGSRSLLGGNLKLVHAERAP